MDTDTIYQQLLEYNANELFYKELFIHQKNPVEYAGLTASMNLETARKRKLIIPGLTVKAGEPSRLGDSYFYMPSQKNVCLLKHDRYMPPYEHGHDFFEIVYVLSGRCENNIFGGTDFLSEGDLCLVSPSVTHSIWTEDGLVLNILIRRSTIQDVFSNIFLGHGVISGFFTNSIYLEDFATCLVFRTDGDTALAKQILEMYGEQKIQDEYSEGIISSMLMIFFNRLVRRYKNTATYPQAVREQNEAVSRILGIIADKFRDITLPDLAKILGYSTVYCSRYVKKITGCSFASLLKKIKLQKAGELLKNTSMGIQEISNACGYENPENFNRAFRQAYGMPPSAFRHPKQ